MPGSGSADRADTSPKAVLNPPVFFISAALIFTISLLGVIAPTLAQRVFTATQDWILDSFGCFYALCIAIFLVFCIILTVGPLGAIKLGPDHAWTVLALANTPADLGWMVAGLFGMSTGFWLASLGKKSTPMSLARVSSCLIAAGR